MPDLNLRRWTRLLVQGRTEKPVTLSILRKDFVRFRHISEKWQSMLRLVLKDGSGSWAAKSFLEKLDSFKNQPELLNADEYSVSSEVRLETLDMVLSRVFGRKGGAKVTAENAQEVKALCKELGFAGLDSEVREVLGDPTSAVPRDVLELKGRVNRHDVLLERLQRQVFELESQLRALSGVPQQVVAVEKKLVDVERNLHAEIHRVDARDELRQVKVAINSKTNTTDMNALREEVTRLKKQTMEKLETMQELVLSCVSAQAVRAFVDDKAKLLDGIIAQLTRECGGNVHDKGVVEVTASSYASSDPDKTYEPKNVAELGTETLFWSKNLEQQWICYDFKNKHVAPTSYSIMSCTDRRGGWHPRSWVLEASNDKSTWTLLDQRDDNSDLNDRSVTCHFSLKNQAQMMFRFVRLRQTGRNHHNSDSFALASLEIFGTLSSK